MQAPTFGSVIMLAVLAGCGDDSGDPAQPIDTCVGPGVWRDGPQLSDRREQAAAVLLPNDQVLVVGGHPTEPGFVPLDSAESYDEATDAWAPTGSLDFKRSSTQLSTVLLENGMVLTADQDFPVRSPSELYDPDTRSWSVTGMMAVLVNGPVVTLPTGDALALGGIDWTTDTPLALAQRYHADSGEWVEAAPLLGPRTGHAAVVIGSEVLIVGGSAAYPSATSLATAEVYDPVEDSWRPAAPMAEGRWGPRAVVLTDGRVLVAGGGRGNDFQSESFATAEIYDPATDSWSPTGSMLEARVMFSLTRLANGRVLAAAGFGAANLDSAEVYNPDAGTWSAAPAMSGVRRLHSAVLLPSGDVLVVGGYDSKQLDTTQIYTPCAG